MKFNLSINVDGAAFDDPYVETARLLRQIATRLDRVCLRSQEDWASSDDYKRQNALGDYPDSRKGWTGHYQTLHDINGNDVGQYAFKPDGD